VKFKEYHRYMITVKILAVSDKTESLIKVKLDDDCQRPRHACSQCDQDDPETRLISSSSSSLFERSMNQPSVRSPESDLGRRVVIR